MLFSLFAVFRKGTSGLTGAVAAFVLLGTLTLAGCGGGSGGPPPPAGVDPALTMAQEQAGVAATAAETAASSAAVAFAALAGKMGAAPEAYGAAEELNDLAQEAAGAARAAADLADDTEDVAMAQMYQSQAEARSADAVALLARLTDPEDGKVAEVEGAHEMLTAGATQAGTDAMAAKDRAQMAVDETDRMYMGYVNAAMKADRDAMTMANTKAAEYADMVDPAMVMTDRDLEDAEANADMAEAEADKADEAAMKVRTAAMNAVTAAASLKYTAIMNANTNGPEGRERRFLENNSGDYELSISRRDDDPAMLGATRLLNPGSTTKAARAFKPVPGNPNMFTFKNEVIIPASSAVEILVLHSDIDEPEMTAHSTAYKKVTGRDFSTAQGGTARAIHSTINPARIGGFSPDLSTGGDARRADFAKGDTVPGTFDDTYSTAYTGTKVLGTFECVRDAGCQATFDAAGKLGANFLGWHFIPDPDYMVGVLDTDYYYYGFWVRTNQPDGYVENYTSVETFAGSRLDPTGGSSSNRFFFDKIEGDATYEGNAAGVYAYKMHMLADGAMTEVEQATSGTFTADVELTANFGSMETSDGVPGMTVSGKVMGFDFMPSVPAGESMKPDADMEVMLEGAIGSRSIDPKAGGALKAARFFGMGMAKMMDVNGEMRPTGKYMPPPVVVGEFQKVDDLSGGKQLGIAGAFGARKQ